jgi:hypothetical protein
VFRLLPAGWWYVLGHSNDGGVGISLIYSDRLRIKKRLRHFQIISFFFLLVWICITVMIVSNSLMASNFDWKKIRSSKWMRIGQGRMSDEYWWKESVVWMFSSFFSFFLTAFFPILSILVVLSRSLTFRYFSITLLSSYFKVYIKIHLDHINKIIIIHCLCIHE